MAKNLIITGSPGVGKTTLIKEAVLRCRDEIGGFYTEQIMEAGARLGFKLKTFDGQEGVLASKRMASPARLNKYGVDLKLLEEAGVRSIREAAARGKIVVIDELGAMEALLDRFRDAALACLSGPCPVLAAMRRGAHDFMDTVKKLDDTRLVALRRENYQEVKREVGLWLETMRTR